MLNKQKILRELDEFISKKASELTTEELIELHQIRKNIAREADPDLLCYWLFRLCQLIAMWYS
jgi:arginyl-tRNA synthetase